jgi:hypothetical protein
MGKVAQIFSAIGPDVGDTEGENEKMTREELDRGSSIEGAQGKRKRTAGDPDARRMTP